MSYAIGCFAFGSPLRHAQDVASTPLGNRGTLLLLVFGFSALYAEKPNTVDHKYHAAVRPEAPLSLTKGAVEGQAQSTPNAGDLVTRVIIHTWCNKKQIYIDENVE